MNKIPLRFRRAAEAATFLMITWLTCCGWSARARAQLVPAPQTPTAAAAASLTDPTLSPDVQLLYGLEAKFAADVAKGGGAAFASYFADDAVTLSNKQPPTQGRAALMADANWSPSEYQLTWKPDGARMSEGRDMGFTWGHYDGHAKDKNGNPVVVGGRYMTVWKKQADGVWKVELDASNEEPPNAGACCSLK